MMREPVQSVVAIAVITLMSVQAAQSGGFSLYTEGSASAIGNFAAGSAAEAVDATTGWYNPAGLVRVKKQEAIVSGVGVFPSTNLTGTSTYNTQLIDTPYVQSFTGLQGAENAFVPALHYVHPLGDRAAWGLSVVSPFGLSTDWGTNSPVRYAATRTELLTMDVSPEIAGQLTKNMSFGLGLDLQWARVKFNSVLGSPAVLQELQSLGAPLTPTTLDSTTNNTGSSFGLGFHTGLLSSFNDDHTRVGLNYQSSVSHTFYGSSTLTGRLANPDFSDIIALFGEVDVPSAVYRSNSLMSNAVALPDVLTLSAYQDLNAKWALLGSMVYTGWHSLKTIQLNNVAAIVPATNDLPPRQGLVNSTATEDYRDTWRFALGANYHINDQWMMRFGGGYDQTPTVLAERDVRLPDSNRLALSVGSHYQIRPNIGLDAGYTYLFALNDGEVNKTQVVGSTSTYYVNAQSKVHAQLLGLQVVWAMDQAVKTA
jgi:long-chain fatty acid transport protein